eukprot:7236718-Pyramimonas_sp.AAC.2
MTGAGAGPAHRAGGAGAADAGECGRADGVSVADGAADGLLPGLHLPVQDADCRSPAGGAARG